ncbi:MAG: hypothetical protein ACKN9T_03130, partial [Candidatus Methylumidiphilus sp.]
ATLLGLLATVDVANAVTAAPVNIAYPLNGATVQNPFYSSFTVNCPASTGAQTVFWSIDGTMVGKVLFYETTGIHFAYRLSPNVTHSLKVTTSCGGVESVVFKVI